MASTGRNAAAKPKTSVYDVAQHLCTPQEMAAYLYAWFEEAPFRCGIRQGIG